MDYSINVVEARRFMGAVFGDKPHHYSYSIDSAKGGRFHSIAGQFADCLPELNQASASGHAIYIPVADIRGKSRRAEDITAITAIFAEDDDGSHRPPFEPSFKVESSPGKYHYWYLLKDPVPNGGSVWSVQHRLIEQWGGDLNARDTTRMLRLPGSWHRKCPDKPFQVRIVSESRNRYTLDDFNNVLTYTAPQETSDWEGVSCDEERDILLKKCRSALAVLDPDCSRRDWTTIGMSIHSVDSGDDGFTLFHEWSAKATNGSYKGESDVQRQWGSYRMKPGGRSILSLFKLARGKGWHDSIPDYVQDIETDDGQTTGPERPTIIIRNDNIHDVISQMESALIAADKVSIFQRAGKLVRVSRDDDTAPIIKTVDDRFLLPAVSESAIFVRQKGDKTRTVEPPDKAIRSYLGLSGKWKVPTLKGVITCPTLDREGNLVARPGYDPATKLWLDCENGFKMADNPTRKDALEALEVFTDEGFSEFPFRERTHQSVFVSQMLTGLVRHTLDSAPIILHSSPKRGSGKSLLSKTAGWMLLGSDPTLIVQGADDVEFEKRLFATLLQGSQIVVIEELKRPLSGEFLCSMTTSKRVSSRVLGASEMAEVHSNCLVIANGNNATVREDAARRVLLCDLDPQCEKPEQRVFKTDVEAWTLDNRTRLIRAGLTILRAYHLAGRPREGGLIPLGGFEGWDSWVRGALCWIGMPDPVETMAEIQADDPVASSLTAVLEVWYALQIGMKAKALTVKEVIAEASNPSNFALKDALLTVAESTRTPDTICPRRLANWLRSNKLRIEGSLRFESPSIDGHSKAPLWQVVKI